MPSWRLYLPLAATVPGLGGILGYRNEVGATTAAGTPSLTLRSAVRHIFTEKTQRKPEVAAQAWVKRRWLVMGSVSLSP